MEDTVPFIGRAQIISRFLGSNSSSDSSGWDGSWMLLFGPSSAPSCCYSLILSFRYQPDTNSFKLNTTFSKEFLSASQCGWLVAPTWKVAIGLIPYGKAVPWSEGPWFSHRLRYNYMSALCADQLQNTIEQDWACLRTPDFCEKQWEFQTKWLPGSVYNDFMIRFSSIVPLLYKHLKNLGVLYRGESWND